MDGINRLASMGTRGYGTRFEFRMHAQHAQELSGTRVAVAWDPLLERGEHAIPQRWTTLLNGTGVVPDGHRGDHDAPR